jgi:hypothetical protein
MSRIHADWCRRLDFAQSVRAKSSFLIRLLPEINEYNHNVITQMRMIQWIDVREEYFKKDGFKSALLTK